MPLKEESSTLTRTSYVAETFHVGLHAGDISLSGDVVDAYELQVFQQSLRKNDHKSVHRDDEKSNRR